MVNNSDSKIKKLKEQGVLNPKAEKVKDELFQKYDFFDPQDLLQVKYEMLRRVQKDGSTVLNASQKFGFSRPSFYKAQNDFITNGLPGLIPRQKGPKQAHKLSGDVMEFVAQAIDKDNKLKAAKIVSLLEKRFNLKVHPRSVERAIARRKKKGKHKAIFL
jgi:transposase